MDDYILEEREREASRRALQADIERVITELYGAEAVKAERPSRALFKRYVWNGLDRVADAA